MRSRTRSGALREGFPAAGSLQASRARRMPPLQPSDHTLAEGDRSPRGRFPHMIGTSPRRKEDQRLLLGGGRFVDDLTRAGLLHLGVVRSAEAHARIVKVGLDRARKAPGVVAAWSAADLDGVAPYMPTAYGGSQKGRTWSQPVLARELVRFVGEALAVVVAESPYALADGLEAVTGDHQRLPAPAPAEAA